MALIHHDDSAYLAALTRLYHTLCLLVGLKELRLKLLDLISQLLYLTIFGLLVLFLLGHEFFYQFVLFLVQLLTLFDCLVSLLDRLVLELQLDVPLLDLLSLLLCCPLPHVNHFLSIAQSQAQHDRFSLVKAPGHLAIDGTCAHDLVDFFILEVKRAQKVRQIAGCIVLLFHMLLLL